jgi:hypothetical protein
MKNVTLLLLSKPSLEAENLQVKARNAARQSVSIDPFISEDSISRSIF